MSRSKQRRTAHRPTPARKPQALEIAHAIEKALALHQQGQLAQAEAVYKAVLERTPDHFWALHMLGVMEAQRQNYDAAVRLIGRALKADANSAMAHSNLGNALNALKRHAEAIASYDRALAIKPDFADALNNRGVALHGLKRHEEALASYDRALALRPDYADAWNNRGNALVSLQRHEEAVAAFERLSALEPAREDVRGKLLHARMQCCRWDAFDALSARVAADVRAGVRSITPFEFLAVCDAPDDQLRAARICVRDQFPPAPSPLWQGERYRHDRIRLAYLSADFREHAVAHLIVGLFERHDRNRFETIALSFGPDRAGEMRARIAAAVERFVDVADKSDREAAAMLRAMEVDIAVDLMGFTSGARTGILARRPAPIQVNYLGYPGTMGADYIDYILADRWVVPAGHERHYAENIVRLPDSYQANDAQRRIAARTPPRTELGLPETGFVFCSFNNSYKITPALFDLWMRLLQRVEGSVLWLLEGSAAAVRNLRHEAAKRGVAPERLVFAARTALDHHLARHRRADLFLDTLPYNAHTTASDALWAGLPVVTCLGASFAGRVAASLLDAVGLAPLITHSLADYEALALALANDPDRLAALKSHLARAPAALPLFDTDRFRRHIESAFETMWARHHRGEPPEPFVVAALTR